MTYKKNFKRVLKTTIFAGAILGSATAFADVGCTYPTLVSNIINHTTNSTVCVDVPVELKKTKVVFNLDTASTTTGLAPGATANTFPIGLRHMWMLATNSAANIDASNLNPAQFNIIGVFHGNAASWALSDAWWNAHGSTTGNPFGSWIKRVLAFNGYAGGMNVQLEICGVTMSGNGWTNSDLYPGIKVNQGAIGRLIDLQQNLGYSYIQEGYVDKAE